MKNIVFAIVLVSAAAQVCRAEAVSTQKLSKYAVLLEKGTYDGADWSIFETPPKSRAYTFQKAFEHFEANDGKVIVELGTTRSFVHGGLPGCNSNDPSYWEPNNPTAWDFGAGSFTRVAVECLQHTNPLFYTVDLAAEHIERSKLITADFAGSMVYKVASSIDFLRDCDFKIDLLYLDTGDMTPIETTALLQLEEAKIIVERDLLSEKGIILIDDVRNQTPRKFGDDSGLGKSKYAIPYFLHNGYEIVADEYQVMLQKAASMKHAPKETTVIDLQQINKAPYIKDAILRNDPLFTDDFLVLHSLMRMVKPRSVFEIGTCTGEGTQIVKNAIGDGVLYSLDLPQDETSYDIKMVGEMCTMPFMQIIGNSRLVNYVQYYPIEAWFIDGAHDYQHVFYETRQALLSAPKLIVWHDADVPEVFAAIKDGLAHSDHLLFRVNNSRIAFSVPASSKVPGLIHD